MSVQEFAKPTTAAPPYTTTRDSMDTGYPGFPMSIVVTGFFVTSLAYLVCFCCCIIQFFIRRTREMRQTANSTQPTNQKNDTLRRRFLKQFRNSLRKLQRSATGDVRELQMTREMSTLGTTSSCPICFDEYTGDPAAILIGKIKSCGHFFHFDCIWTWLEARGNCPLCREKAQLKEEDIQALALRHLLHELKKNEQDHTIVNMTDEGHKKSDSSTSNDDSSTRPSSTEYENDENDIEGPSRGVVNDGFEDVDLSEDSNSATPVEFTVGDETAVTISKDSKSAAECAKPSSDSDSKDSVHSNEVSEASSSPKDNEELTLNASNLKDPSEKDSTSAQPPEV